MFRRDRGGRDHLHFRLVDAGIRERTIVIGYWIFCAAFGVITLLLNGTAQKIMALGMLGFVALGVLIWASHTKEVGIDREQKEIQ